MESSKLPFQPSTVASGLLTLASLAAQYVASEGMREDRAKMEECQRKMEAANERARIAQEGLVLERQASVTKVREARQNERELMQAEKLREWTELNREYPIPAHLNRCVSDIRTVGKQRFVNVGLLGDSGVGKSSLIKVMLEHFGSTGQVQPATSFQGDGTQAPTPYLLKELGDKIRIWDLPGQGTEQFPAKTYLRDMGLKYFDAVLLVTASRLTENDRCLLAAIKHSGILANVVRTRMDQAVEAGENDKGLSQEEVIQQVRKKLEEQLEDSTKVYLVTTRSKYWTGGHGGAKFGTIEKLCEDVAQHVKSKQALED